MPKKLDLTGYRVGRLTVVSFAGHRRTVSGTSIRFWLCECECGNTCLVSTDCLRKGVTRSCGCLKREKDKTNSNRLLHGLSKTRPYKIWIDIKRRCKDCQRPSYQYYGGKGVKICQEWESDFMAFYKWAIANGYDDSLSIDRIDVNGDYCPENCRWVTNKIQANNTTRNRFITYDGRTQTLAQWADELGVSRTLISDRLDRLGWPVDMALSVSPGSETKSEKLLTLGNETHNISTWSEILGINRKTITERIKAGLPIEKVLTPKGNKEE